MICTVGVKGGRISAVSRHKLISDNGQSKSTKELCEDGLQLLMAQSYGRTFSEQV